MAHVPTDLSLQAWIWQLIADNKLYMFYKSVEWDELRNEVLRECHYECQHCLKEGIYKRADMVHHVNEVRKRPDLALTKEYTDPITKEQIKNLIALCNQCHERVHDRAGLAKMQHKRAGFKNEERW